MRRSPIIRPAIAGIAFTLSLLGGVAASAATPREALAAVAPAGSVGAANPAPLNVVAYRFWRAPDQTLVEAFAEVPWSRLGFEGEAERSVARFLAVLEVRDSGGMVLTRQSWSDSVVSPRLPTESLSRASSVQHVRFALAPGRYTVRVTLEGDDGRLIGTGETTVVAHAVRPAHSDLVLAAAFDVQHAEAAEPVAGAIRRGELSIVPNLAGVLASDRSKLGLFLEVYDDAATARQAKASIRIDGVGSSFRYRSPPQPRTLAPNAGEAFAVDLSGLPPGEYRLTAEWVAAGDTLRATHPLRILPPGAGVATLPGEQVYAGLEEPQLDSIFAPMEVIASPLERVDWETTNGAADKRRLLAGFWATRAARTGLSAETLRRDWEERLEFVELSYRPARRGRGGMKSWQTPRGRLYLKLGPPAETYVEAQRQEQSNPWEMWRYTSGRGDVFVFHDRSGFGDYELVYSSDPAVPDVPQWQAYFTEDALRRIAMW